jgi:hypothetical protein
VGFQIIQQWAVWSSCSAWCAVCCALACCACPCCLLHAGLHLLECALTCRAMLCCAVPQVLRVTPSTVFVAGTGRQLLQFSFQLEHLHCFEVSSESVFGLSQDADSGMVAVSGSRGCLDLLSDQGTSLGHIKPPESVFMAAA